MLLLAYLYFLAMITLVLGTYAIIAYAFPDSLPGRVAAILRG